MVEELFQGLVAVGTSWLAWETRQMSKASKAMLTLDSEPYVSLLRVDFSMGPDHSLNPPPPAVQVSLVFRNPGKVRTIAEIKHMMVSLQGTEQPKGNVAGQKFVLHPGEEIDYAYPPIHTTIPVGTLTNILTEFKADFWAAETQKHSVSFEVSVQTLGTPGPHKWRYAKGPDFT